MNERKHGRQLICISSYNPEISRLSQSVIRTPLRSSHLERHALLRSFWPHTKNIAKHRPAYWGIVHMHCHSNEPDGLCTHRLARMEESPRRAQEVGSVPHAGVRVERPHGLEIGVEHLSEFDLQPEGFRLQCEALCDHGVCQKRDDCWCQREGQKRAIHCFAVSHIV